MLTHVRRGARRGMTIAKRNKGVVLTTAGAAALNAAVNYGPRAVNAAAKTIQRKWRNYKKSKKASGVALVSKSFDGVYKTNIRFPAGKLSKTNRVLVKNNVTSSTGANATGLIDLVIGRQVPTIFATQPVLTDFQQMVPNISQNGIYHGHTYDNMTTNASNATIFLDVYFFLCKRNTKTSVLQQWQALAAAYGDAPQPAEWSNTPKQFKEIFKDWRLMKKAKFNLAPGQTWRLKWSHFPQKFLNSQNLLTVDQDPYQRNLTCQGLIIAHGIPLNDTVVKGQVSMGYVQRLNIVSSSKYWFTRFPSTPYMKTFNDGLAIAYTTAPSVMKEDVDEQAAGQNA